MPVRASKAALCPAVCPCRPESRPLCHLPSSLLRTVPAISIDLVHLSVGRGHPHRYVGAYRSYYCTDIHDLMIDCLRSHCYHQDYCHSYCSNGALHPFSHSSFSLFICALSPFLLFLVFLVVPNTCWFHSQKSL